MLGEHTADRLDPESVPVIVDESDYHGSRRSDFRAKKDDAAGRIESWCEFDVVEHRGMGAPPQIRAALLLRLGANWWSAGRLHAFAVEGLGKRRGHARLSHEAG